MFFIELALPRPQKHQKHHALHPTRNLGELDFIVKVAWTLEEAVKLLEGGFQYVCDYENGKIFRKPK
jgi:hypothetical protein